MSGLRIAFVWDWEATSQTNDWQDGLAAALKQLHERGNEVQVFTCGEDRTIESPYHTIMVTKDMYEEVKAYTPDVILHWGDFTRPNAKPLSELGLPMAICFAGGEANNYNTSLFDHIFVESQVYKDQLEEHGFDNVSIAFGTNTNLFAPINQKKVFDTIFPATFAEWKRHNLYAEAVEGLNSLAVGHMYTNHETECWLDCVKRGTVILPHVSAQVLHCLYAASKICIVTSRSGGGSQRTVLEAMSMNIPTIVTDSDKFDFAENRVWRVNPDPMDIRAYVATLLDGEPDINTRDFVVENWSEFTYADSLEKGLKSIL